MSGWVPSMAAAKKPADLEICRRLASLVRGEQVGLEEAEWRAFCARLERTLAAAEPRAGESFIVNIDGAARGNPGPAAIGVLIVDHTGKTVHEHGERIGQTTNNVAEYRALIRALELVQDLGAKSIKVRSDSELLAKQMNGLYRVKNEQLLPLYMEARQMCQNFASVEIVHVPRGQNRRADQLANMALDAPDSEA
jgi:ribonuclease HI